MGKFTDISGTRYGRLIVLGLYRKKKGGSLWRCLCDCGVKRVVSIGSLSSGNTKSCGCYMRDRGREENITHGKSKTRIHRIWMNMRTRCGNKNIPTYRHYGGRGIRVCKRWEKFENFYADMGDPPTNKHTLDRINNDGNYTPKNCRWATTKEQRRNSKQNKFLTFRGKTKCLTDWADECGLKRYTIWDRIRLGWTVEQILTTSLRGKR